MNIRYSCAFNIFVLVYISVEMSVLQAFVVNVKCAGDRAAVSTLACMAQYMKVVRYSRQTMVSSGLHVPAWL